MSSVRGLPSLTGYTVKSDWPESAKTQKRAKVRHRPSNNSSSNDDTTSNTSTIGSSASKTLFRCLEAPDTRIWQGFGTMTWVGFVLWLSSYFTSRLRRASDCSHFQTQ